MARRRRSVKVEWMQVPEDLRTARAPALALMLSRVGGKKVSAGDAYKLVVDLWAWVVSQVDETNEDLRAEFERAATLRSDIAPAVISMATLWPMPKMGALIECLADPMVRVLAIGGDGHWHVLGISDRYLSLASSLREGRERAKVASIAKAHGWKAGEKGTWRHEERGVTLADRGALVKQLKADGHL